ncbi:Ig-like domain-containing protein [Cellulomonas sp. NPDC089187]|uniref:beta strand repeat-containing protein n=1 Tax=Cellulomonas sp. NPDC089187 TaxID=3154970 RepID=UPI00342F44BF
MSVGRGRGRPSLREKLGIVMVAVLVMLLGGIAPTGALAAASATATTGDSAADPTGDATVADAGQEATVPDTESTSADADAADSAPVDGTENQAAAAESNAPAATERSAAAPAAGTVGLASGLELTVTQDGTAPWDADDEPGNDSSATNGIVRTHDSVVYLWGYSVATAGDVTLTQTLPEGMSWVAAESLAACSAPNSGVSDDGRTLTCVREHETTGASTYQVRALVDYAANEQVLSTMLSSAGTADSAPATVTVSAAPRLSMHLNSAAAGYTERNGVAGQQVNLNVYPYQQIDPVKGTRGLEALADEITFTLETTGFGDNFTVGTWCKADPSGLNLRLDTTSAGNNTTNGVPKAGTWTCSQSAPGEPITVKITGAITDVRSYPTATSVQTLDRSRAYVSAATLSLWLPQTDYTEPRSLSFQFRDFDPVSVSGQSNFGDGYAPGFEPGAALINNTNGGQLSISLDTSSGFGMNRVYAPTGTLSWLTPVPDGTDTVTSGNAPMLPGQTLRFGGYVQYKTSDGSLLDRVDVCGVWDETTMTGGETIGQNVPIAAIEYAHIDGLTTDAQRRVYDCGVTGDGAAGWSSTKDGVTGGADAVNAVRYTFTDVHNDTAPYSGVTLTRTDKPLALNTPLYVFFSAQAEGGQRSYDGSTLRARALAANVETSVDISWDAATSDPGLVRTVTVQPTVTVPVGASGVAENASAQVTLPGNTQLVTGSWSGDAPTDQVTNADGSVTYTFPLGDLAANEVATPLTFQVRLPGATAITMPATITASAVIESDGDARTADYRTDSSSIVINPPATFGITKSATATYAIPGVPVVYTIGWYNGLAGSAGTGKIVDVLPYNGDGRGTEGLNGLTVTGVSVEADMSVDIEYTTEDSATVMAAIQADRSGDTGVAWQAWPTDGSVPSGVAAVRFLTGEIVGGTGGEAIIEVTPGVLSLNGSIVNDVSGLVTGLDTPVSGAAGLELVSGAAQIAGTVYLDDDYSWAMDGAESGLGDVTVRATGYTFGANQIDESGAGDDIVVTEADDLSVTTEADGTYALDGLSPGKWTLAVDPSSAGVAGLDAAELPEQPIVLAPADGITGVDFGYMDPIDAPVLVNDTARVSAGDTITLDVLTNDTFDVSGAITEVSSPDSGTVTWAEGDTTIDYTAATDGSGDVTFTYTVTDKARQSRTATVTVTVVPLPTAANSTVTIGQEPTAIDLAGLITGDALVVSTTSAAASVSGTSVTYTPAADFAGQDTFTYTVTDSMGKTATATITVVVLQAPDLSDDATSTLTDTPVTIDVTANDAFVGTGTLEVATDPGHGTAVLDGTDIVYTPEAGWTGTDTFTYSVTDVAGQTDTATVTVIVVDPIALTDDEAVTGEATAVTIDVLANDVATGGVITGVTQGSLGSVSIVDGKVVYTPTGIGTDTFTYTVEDNAGTTATATVTVTVYAAPAATDDSTWTLVDTAVTVPVLVNDQNTDDSTVTISTGPTHGTATVTDAGIVYTPASGWTGTDTVSYTLTDPAGQTSTATVTIVVVEAVTATVDTARTGMETAVAIPVLDNDVVTNGGITGTTDPVNGTIVVGADGVITYTPAADFSGTDTFTYTITDAAGQSATANVTVTVVARPTGEDASVRTGLDTAVSVDLVSTGDALVLSVATDGAHGTATVSGGTVTYTPDAGYVGTDQVTLTWTDSVGQTVTVTLDVEVVDAPVANDDLAETTMGVAVTVPVLDNDQGDAITVTAVSTPMFGTATVDDQGRITYTPAPEFSGKDTVVYTVTDSVGQTAEATFTIAVYTTPRPADLTGVTGLGMELVFDPVADSPAVERVIQAPWSVTAVGTTEAGTTELLPDGTISFVPAEGFTGEATFTYEVTDSLGQVATATITVQVVEVTMDDLTVETGYESAVTVDVLAGASGHEVVVQEVGVPSHGTAVLNEDGTVTYTPAAGFSGTDTFTVTVVDSLGQVATATVTVTVGEAPAPPTVAEPDPEPSASAPPARGSGVLAITGQQASGMVFLAVLVLTAGWWLVRWTRRRRLSTSD